MENSFKKNLFFRGFNFLMNETHIYPYFKLKSFLKNNKGKIYNVNYIWRPPEIHVAKIMEEKIKEGDTVFDIGAHFGYYTLLMAKKVGYLGKVISFEPSKKTREILRKNVRKNNFQNRVKIENKGVSNKEEILRFNYKEFSPMNSFLDRNFPGGTKIECIDIDSYCEKNFIGPDFLKIDAEAFEEKVITGMKKVIKKFHPKVVLEMDKDSSGSKNIFKIFKDSGYKIYTWEKRIDEDSYINMKEIKKPEEIITKETYFEFNEKN